MDIGTVRGLITLFLLLAFVGVVIWAYSKRRKASFDEAANLVFADDEQPSADNKNAGAKQ